MDEGDMMLYLRKNFIIDAIERRSLTLLVRNMKVEKPVEKEKTPVSLNSVKIFSSEMVHFPKRKLLRI